MIDLRLITWLNKLNWNSVDDYLIINDLLIGISFRDRMGSDVLA